MDDADNIFGNHPEFADTTNFVTCPASPDDLFSIFQSLDAELAQLDTSYHTPDSVASFAEPVSAGAGQKSSSSHFSQESELENDQAEGAATGWTASPNKKRLRADVESSDMEKEEGQHRISHITVERNRRKQMNEHLSVLRSLMPCFYVKRGDQASIIGGVVDYITELQQILQSLEAKKQRKVVYCETVLSSPRPTPSPKPSPLSPMSKPPLSPRVNLPISPRTPQPASPYRPKMMQPQVSSGSGSCYNNGLSCPSPTSSTSSSINENLNELAANSKSSLANVEVKFSGVNLLLLKTVSPRIPGQVTKIMSVLEELSLETLQVNINSFDETAVNSFTIKIGIECQLSAEEVAHQIQQTFH